MARDQKWFSGHFFINTIGNLIFEKGEQMKHYGNIDLNQNQLQNAVLPLDAYFPASPKVGQLVFKNKVLYICVEIQNDLPVWTPLTQEINTFLFSQAIGAATWTIEHTLNSSIVQVQVFGNDGKMVIPNEVTIVDKDTVTVDFGIPFAGRAVLMVGAIDGNTRPMYGFEFDQTSLSNTWTVNHNLGYYPVVRVFVGNEEVQPAQIIHDSVNTTRILFTEQYVGVAKFI